MSARSGSLDAPSSDSSAIRLVPRTDIEIVCREPDGSDSQFDCRRLFLGAHERELRRAFADAVKLFSEIRDDSELAARLGGAEEILRLYQIGADSRSILMRDSIFRRPGPTDSLELALKFSRGRRRRYYPLSLDRLAIAGNFLPALNRGCGETAIGDSLVRLFSADVAAWAANLIDELKRDGFVKSVADSSAEPELPAGPAVTFLGHSALLMRSRESAIVVDPVFLGPLGSSPAVFDIAGLKLDAICCSHAHWDHCNPDTLLRFDKNTPVLIPAVRNPSAFNPPILPMLKLLGFTDVREADLWLPHRFGGVEVLPVPFYGEQDEPGAEIDHYTYVLKADGFSVYGGVDCYRDSFGDMRQVVERVAAYKPDVAFLPVSRMIYKYGWGGVNSFCRYLDRTLLDRWFQYTAGPDYAAELAAASGARYAVPYATFTFSRFAAAPEEMQFGAVLRGRSRAESFYPLQPMDSIALADLRDGMRSSVRRRKLVWRQAAVVFAVRARRSRFASRILAMLRPMRIAVNSPLRWGLLMHSRALNNAQKR